MAARIFIYGYLIFIALLGLWFLYKLLIVSYKGFLYLRETFAKENPAQIIKDDISEFIVGIKNDFGRHIMLLFMFGFFVASLMTLAFYDSFKYSDTSYFVHAYDEKVFSEPIKDGDTRIRNNGKLPTTDCAALDKEFDNGDGKKKGLFRWYTCQGVECDDSWQYRFK